MNNLNSTKAVSLLVVFAGLLLLWVASSSLPKAVPILAFVAFFAVALLFLAALPFLPVIISLLALNRNLKAAEKVAQFGLYLHQKMSPLSSETVYHLGLLAEVLRGQGRYGEAEATVREALALIKERNEQMAKLSVSSPALVSQSQQNNEKEALIHELLGSILRDQSRYSEALRSGKKACEMMEELQKLVENAGQKSAVTVGTFVPVPKISAAQARFYRADSYYELARTLNFTGQPDDAITLLHQALELRDGKLDEEEVSSKADRYKANILTELSRAYLMIGEYKEAECAADKALSNLQTSEQAEEQLSRARVLLAIADVLKQAPEKSADERARAHGMRSEALQIRKKWLAANDPELLDIGGG